MAGVGTTGAAAGGVFVVLGGVSGFAAVEAVVLSWPRVASALDNDSLPILRRPVRLLGNGGRPWRPPPLLVPDICCRKRYIVSLAEGCGSHTKYFSCRPGSVHQPQRRL